MKSELHCVACRSMLYLISHHMVLDSTRDSVLSLEVEGTGGGRKQAPRESNQSNQRMRNSPSAYIRAGAGLFCFCWQERKRIESLREAGCEGNQPNGRPGVSDIDVNKQQEGWRGMRCEQPRGRRRRKRRRDDDDEALLSSMHFLHLQYSKNCNSRLLYLHIYQTTVKSYEVPPSPTPPVLPRRRCRERTLDPQAPSPTCPKISSLPPPSVSSFSFSDYDTPSPLPPPLPPPPPPVTRLVFQFSSRGHRGCPSSAFWLFEERQFGLRPHPRTR